MLARSASTQRLCISHSVRSSAYRFAPEANPPVRTTVAPANTSALVEAPAAANPSAMPAADTIPSLRSTIDSRVRSRQPLRSSIRRARCNQLMAREYAGILERYRAEKITLVGRTDINELRRALYNGKVDAVTTDDVILAGIAAHGTYNGVLKVLGTTFSSLPRPPTPGTV